MLYCVYFTDRDACRRIGRQMKDINRLKQTIHFLVCFVYSLCISSASKDFCSLCIFDGASVSSDCYDACFMCVCVSNNFSYYRAMMIPKIIREIINRAKCRCSIQLQHIYDYHISYHYYYLL